MVILNAKIADNLAKMRFMVDFFMSKVGNHMGANCCKICFAIEPFFPQHFCIGPLWNVYIPLYMDCVVLYALDVVKVLEELGELGEL